MFKFLAWITRKSSGPNHFFLGCFLVINSISLWVCSDFLYLLESVLVSVSFGILHPIPKCVWGGGSPPYHQQPILWEYQLGVLQFNLLPSPSSLYLLHDRPVNQETRCWGKEYDFILKAGRQKRWQTSVSKEPSYWGLDASFFYRTERGRRWGSNVKRP